MAAVCRNSKCYGKVLDAASATCSGGSSRSLGLVAVVSPASKVS
jgi:hypothetical protein